MTYIKQTMVMFFALTLCMSSYAHQTDREIMLQIENDELVLRLAEVLIENRRLEKFANEALSAKKAGQKVVAGCDPLVLQKNIFVDWASLGDIGISSKSESWIRDYGPKCTVNQLKTIYIQIEDYLYYFSTSKKMLNFMIKSRS